MQMIDERGYSFTRYEKQNMGKQIMKTTISIITGVMLGFASVAWAISPSSDIHTAAVECPREMTDDNCERLKEEARNRAAAEAASMLAYCGSRGCGGPYQEYYREINGYLYHCRGYPNYMKCTLVEELEANAEGAAPRTLMIAQPTGHGGFFGGPNADGSKWIERGGNTRMAGVDKGKGSFTECDSGQCVTCTAEGCYTAEAMPEGLEYEGENQQARIYCDRDGNCTSPGQGKSASTESPTQMATMNPEEGKVVHYCDADMVTCRSCHTYTGECWTYPNPNTASAESPTQMAGMKYKCFESGNCYYCDPYGTCYQADADGTTEAPAMLAYHGYSRPQGSGNSGPTLTRYWTEERDDGKYFCKEFSNGKVECTHIPHSASTESPTQMAGMKYKCFESGNCYYCDPYGTCYQADADGTTEAPAMLASTFSHIDNWTEDREDGTYYCKVQIDTDGNRMGEPDCYLTTTAGAPIEAPTMLAEGGCYENDDGSVTCYGEDGSVIQANAEQRTMMASSEVIHCDAGLCYTCDESGSCRDIDSGSASREQRTMVAHLRLGDPVGAGCQTEWECFGHQDSSPVLRNVNPDVFMTAYGDGAETGSLGSR